MSPFPSAWRVLLPERVALHDLREALEAARSRGVHVFVDVLLVEGPVGASPKCADPDSPMYRTGERVFVRAGSDEELLEQIRRGLALLDRADALPSPTETLHATG